MKPKYSVGPVLRLSLAAALTLVASWATAAMFFELGPSTVIYPKQQNPLIFNHNYHVRDADEAKGIKGEGLECDFCHEELAESRLASDRHIPGHDDCELCHEEWIGDEDTPAAPQDCARCHADIDPSSTSTVAEPMVIPPPNIRFAHSIHLEAGSECKDCHPRVASKGLAVRDDYPTMDRCIDCHQEAKVGVECEACHYTDGRGKVLQTYSSGVLKPKRYHAFAIHDANFLRDHAVPAQRERAYCDECHTQNDCMRCHDGIARNVRYHPDAWMAQHSLRARKDDFRCQSCHRVQTFCLTCHIRSGVASAGSLANPLQRRTVQLTNPTDPFSAPRGPHPMGFEGGWLDPASRNFHGFHAQRNIRACAACHQENYCIQCHGSARGDRQGLGGGNNPHGPNPGRLRGSPAARQNARACLKCHSPSDPSWR